MADQLAVIVGSGFPELSDGAPLPLRENRFGGPSAALRRVELGGDEVITLPRHGDEHTIPPHKINYRANLLALQEAGVSDVIALCTVGIITPIVPPGQIGVPDQIVDYTWGREHTVFGGDDGQVEHIEFTEPFAATIRHRLLEAARRADVDCFDGGVYGAVQGPRLETAAEINRMERDQVDYVGMTAMPEAAIAAELGLRYACIAMVVNPAAGRGDGPIHGDVLANTEAARNATKSVLRHYVAAEN